MRRSALILFSLGLSCLLWAQTSKRKLARLYYQGNYEELTQTASASQLETLPADHLLYYASSYYQLGDKERAYTLYQKAFSQLKPQEVEPNFLVEYGRLLIYHENPEPALTLLREAHRRLFMPESLEMVDLYLSYARQLMNNTPDATPSTFRWVVHNLSELNTPSHEYSLFIHKGVIYFITRRNSERGRDPEDLLPYEALYYKRANEQEEPKHIGFYPKWHEGVAGFYGDTMIVYRSAKRRGDFYIAYPAGTGWKSPVFWGAFPNSKKGSEDAMSYDPKTGRIIFSSDRKGTKGKEDLWMTYRLPNGKWSEPQNIEELNTPYDEDAPFIVGDSLFFAHDGPTSLGGYDLYLSIRQPDGKWGKPIRLPRPFNSPAHDTYLFMSSPDSIYISSDRLGSQGRMDLFLIVRETPPPPPPPAPRAFSFQAKGYDLRTGAPVGIQVILRPYEQPEGMQVLRGVSDSLYPKPQAGTYFLHATAPGYAQYLSLVQIPDTGDFIQQVAMVRIEDLYSLNWPRIHFDFDKSYLRQDFRAAIDTVLQIMQRYPNIIIEVGGHTDSIGSVAYNQGLSERRANTIFKHLVEKGVPPHRMRARGYGEEMPWKPNDTPYNRFLNRRVEFKPLSGENQTP
ncbi:MAG: OmpA family protein [Bacteroidia bacterium]|nr:OmpA family protein [Bacteroidia bacterium]MDW8235498.1 OmpA family protein [Bacteroidia bacterium]